MPLPYVQPSSFSTAVPLTDGTDDYGMVYLCPNTLGVPASAIDFPPQLKGVSFPPKPPSGNTTFPEVFEMLSYNIGAELSKMNKALLELQRFSLGGTISAAWLTTYIQSAARIVDVLNLKGATKNFWPLIPRNSGFRNTTGFNNGPSNPDGLFVSNADVANTNFPPAGKNEMHFLVDIPGYGKVHGRITFTQDAQWKSRSATDPLLTDMDWSSWGFVTNFILELWDQGPSFSSSGVSSSSSSYYAASSSYPGGGGRPTHHCHDHEKDHEH